MKTIFLSRAAVLGYFPEHPGKSCMEIKTTEGERALSGTYWLKKHGSHVSGNIYLFIYLFIYFQLHLSIIVSLI